MNLNQVLTQVLSGALVNTWPIELPPAPVWPAAVFDVESTPEEAWCMGGGYTQHDVHLVVMARDLDEIDTLLPLGGGGPFRAALEALDSYQYEAGCGDADYEPDPQIYARHLTVRLRTPRY